MDGVLWTILACIGTFVYRLYSKNPKQFVENWSRFIKNLTSLFDPGRREAAGNGETGTTDDKKGPERTIRGGRGRGHSVSLTEAKDLLNPIGKSGREGPNPERETAAGEVGPGDPKSAQTPSRGNGKDRSEITVEDGKGNQSGSEIEDDSLVKEPSSKLQDAEKKGEPPAKKGKSDDGEVAEKRSSGKGKSKLKSDPKGKGKPDPKPKAKGKRKGSKDGDGSKEEGENDEGDKSNAVDRGDNGDSDSDTVNAPSSDPKSKPDAKKKAKSTSNPVAPPSASPVRKASKSSKKGTKGTTAADSDSGGEQQVQDAEDSPDEDVKSPSAKGEVGGSSGATGRRKKGASPVKRKPSGKQPVATELADSDQSDAGSGPDDTAAPPSGNKTRRSARGRRPAPDHKNKYEDRGDVTDKTGSSHKDDVDENDRGYSHSFYDSPPPTRSDTRISKSSGKGYKKSSRPVESGSADANEGGEGEDSSTDPYKRAESPGAEAAQASGARKEKASSQLGEPSRRRPKTNKAGDVQESDDGSEEDAEDSSSYSDDVGDKRQRKTHKSSRDSSLPPYDDRKISDTTQDPRTGHAGEKIRRTERRQFPQGGDPTNDDESDSQNEQGQSQRRERTARRSSSPDTRKEKSSSSSDRESSPSGHADMADMGRPQRPPNPEGMENAGDKKDRKGQEYSGDESESRRPGQDRTGDEKETSPLPPYSPTKDPTRRKEVPRQDSSGEREPSTSEKPDKRPPRQTGQDSDSDNERDPKREQRKKVDLADVPITDEAKGTSPDATQAPGSEKKNDASSPIKKVPRERRKRPQGTADNAGADVDSKSKEGDMKTYYAEDAKGDATRNQDAPASPESAVRPDHRSPEQLEKDRSEKPRHQTKKERKEAKKEAKEARAKERAANHDSERGAAPPEPHKGFWRGLKDAFQNARQHKTKSLVCFALAIGYVIATGYGNEYGRTTPAVKSSAPSLSARQLASTGLEDSVSGAITSAKQQLGSVDVSPSTLQRNFLAISILWHLAVQFTIVFLISEIIAPPPKPAPTPDGKEPAPKKSRWRASKDSYSLGYHSIKDPISNAWHMARRATKWTYIRLGLISFLGLTMVLVARQLSSLAHIAANPTAGPWSDWPDVTVLHHSLQANVSQLGDGGRILAASLGFWGMTMTAFVYCLSSLADRPTVAPVDEEMAVVEKEKEKKVAAE